MTLHTLLVSLGTDVVGESAGWRNVLALAPRTHPEVIVISWGLIAARSTAALRELRSVCPNTVVIVTPGAGGATQRPSNSTVTLRLEDQERPENNDFERLLADRLQVILARVW